MKTIDQLEEKKLELKKRISLLLNEFYEQNGFCEIDIKTSYAYTEMPSGVKKLFGTDLTIDIKI